jgi:hypothetical protein
VFAREPMSTAANPIMIRRMPVLIEFTLSSLLSDSSGFGDVFFDVFDFF